MTPVACIPFPGEAASTVRHQQLLQGGFPPQTTTKHPNPKLLNPDTIKIVIFNNQTKKTERQYFIKFLDVVNFVPETTINGGDGVQYCNIHTPLV